MTLNSADIITLASLIDSFEFADQTWAEFSEYLVNENKLEALQKIFKIDFEETKTHKITDITREHYITLKRFTDSVFLLNNVDLASHLEKTKNLIANILIEQSLTSEEINELTK